jgi:hypothetical protein
VYTQVVAPRTTKPHPITFVSFVSFASFVVEYFHRR